MINLAKFKFHLIQLLAHTEDVLFIPTQFLLLLLLATWKPPTISSHQRFKTLFRVLSHFHCLLFISSCFLRSSRCRLDASLTLTLALSLTLSVYLSIYLSVCLFSSMRASSSQATSLTLLKRSAKMKSMRTSTITNFKSLLCKWKQPSFNVSHSPLLLMAKVIFTKQREFFYKLVASSRKLFST